MAANFCTQGGVTAFCMARFNTEGSIDSTCGTGGFAFGPTGAVRQANAFLISNYDGVPSQIMPLPDGSFVEAAREQL